MVPALRVGSDTAPFAGGSAPTLGGPSARIAVGLAGVARRALREARAGGTGLDVSPMPGPRYRLWLVHALGRSAALIAA